MRAGLKAAGSVGCLARCSAAQMAVKKAELKVPLSAASMVERKAQSSADM